MSKREVVVLDTCDCCVLVDGDLTHKSVKWCPICGAWLCEACRGNWTKRGAAVWEKIRRIVDGVDGPHDDAV